MTLAWRRMLVVLVSLGKCHYGYENEAPADESSHIKGVASHKIVSDGKLLNDHGVASTMHVLTTLSQASPLQHDPSWSRWL